MTLFSQDRALLDAYRRGDSSALAMVYEAYVSQVVDVLRHGFAFQSQGRTLRFQGFVDPVELEGFTQEVFLRAFSERARLGYDGLRPFAPYLLAIGRNRIIDEIRRRRTELERVVGPIEDHPEPPDDATPLDERLDAARACDAVAAFVSSRPEVERRFIEARFTRDLSLLATARELDMGRMRARLLERRILKALKRHLERAGYLDGDEPAFALGVVIL